MISILILLLMAMMHLEDRYLNSSANETTILWWNELCGNYSPYNAFWVSIIFYFSFFIGLIIVCFFRVGMWHCKCHTVCLKNNAHWVFFCNLKYLKLIFVVLAHSILISTASKCMHNFPPRLSCVATLVENGLSTE